MKSIAREDFLDTDPYGDKEKEAEEKQDKLDYLADRAREDNDLNKEK
jgi:hypothetical protein